MDGTTVTGVTAAILSLVGTSVTGFLALRGIAGGKRVDEKIATEGNLYKEIVDLRNRWAEERKLSMEQEKRCQERLDKLEAEIEELKTERDSLRQQLIRLNNAVGFSNPRPATDFFKE